MDSRVVKLLVGLGLAGGLWWYFRQTNQGRAVAQKIITKGKQIVKQIDKAGTEAVAHFEGFRAYKYNDPPGSAHYSIGYGHQIKPGESFTEPMSHETALQLLAQDTGIAQRAVRASITAPINQQQFDSLVDLVYNIGTGNWAKSGIAEAINGGEYAHAVALIKAHNKAHVNGVLTVLPELVARRAKDAAPFESVA